MTKEEIMDAASVAADKRGWSSEGSGIVYDESNAILNFFFSAWHMPGLDGRDYRTVIYRNRGNGRPRDLWISIDEYTAEVLVVFESPGYVDSRDTTGVEATPVESRTQGSGHQAHARKHALPREQIIDAAKAAAKQHSWDPDKSSVIYDEGNVIWKFCWPIRDRKFEGHDCQAVIFRRRVSIPGGDLFVVVDGNKGEVLTVLHGE